MENRNGGKTRNVLTHLQQLREWQRRQQHDLRGTQQLNFQQLQAEQLKVQQLLDSHLPKDLKKNAAEGLSIQKSMNEMKKGIPDRNTNMNTKSTTRNITTTSSDQPAEISKKSATEKGPFPYLRRGEGLAKYKAFARSTGRNTSSKKIAPSSAPHVKIKPLVPISKLKFKSLQLNQKEKETAFIDDNDTCITIFEKNRPEKLPKNDHVFSIKNGNRKEFMNTEVHKKDADELVEFEILERVTDNCSIDSDSSLVTHFLNKKGVEKDKRSEPGRKSTNRQAQLETHGEFSIPEEQSLTISFEEESKQRTQSLDPFASFPSSKGVSTLSDDIVPLPGQVAFDNVAQYDDQHEWKSNCSEDWSVSTFESSLGNTSNQVLSAAAFGVTREEAVNMVPSTDSNRILLQQRLKELEEEIAAFRKENALLAKLKSQQQQAMKDLEKEGDLLKKEQVAFEKYKKDEKEKLKKQQHVFETYQKAKQNLPDKKEREEIAALKAEIHKSREDMNKQRAHLSAECGRLRTQLSFTEAEKEQMRLEMARLQKDKEHTAQLLKEQQASALLSKANARPKKMKCPPIRPTLKSSLRRSRSSPAKNKSDPQTPKVKEPGLAISNKKKLNPGGNKVHFSNEIEECQLAQEVQVQAEAEQVVEEIQHFDKTEKILGNGEREFVYSSGTQKVISADGTTTQIYFYNGDVMITLYDKTEVYHFAESGTKQSRFPDGTTLLEFSDGQEERIFKNGRKEQKFADGTVHVTHPDGSQEVTSPDGTVLKVQEDGLQLLEFPNGEKEIRTADFKKRDYLDGTVKTIYNDGRQETRYADGRLRLKDKDGKLLVDTKHSAG